LDENDYPVKPDGTVAPVHLTLYFSERSANLKFHERKVQNKLAKAKRDASQQTKDSAPDVQSNVMTPPLPPARECHDFPGIRSVGVDEIPRTGKKKKKKFKVAHGLDTTDFEVSNGDKITLNFHGK